jgi:uncharacterized protein YjbI with pentapeptide repeats
MVQELFALSQTGSVRIAFDLVRCRLVEGNGLVFRLTLARYFKGDLYMRLDSQQVWDLIQLAAERGEVVDLSGQDISLLGLGDANLTGAIITDARLVETNLAGAELRGADFTNSDLTEVSFFRADLRGANLTSTYLFQTTLREANLEGANLSHARLNGADLYRANLKGIDLQGAEYNQRTRWPVDFDPKAAGAIYK